MREPLCDTQETMMARPFQTDTDDPGRIQRVLDIYQRVWREQDRLKKIHFYRLQEQRKRAAQRAKGADALTYMDAAAQYGYTYDTIRTLVARGWLQTILVNGRRVITHAEMQRHRKSVGRMGRPRKSTRPA